MQHTLETVEDTSPGYNPDPEVLDSDSLASADAGNLHLPPLVNQYYVEDTSDVDC